MQPVEWRFFSTKCRCIGSNKSHIGESMLPDALLTFGYQSRRNIDTDDIAVRRNFLGNGH